MRTFNRITLLGRVGKPPEVRQSAKGVDVARLTLATNRPVRDGEQWVEQADWHNIVCFDQTARFVAERVAVGDALLVDGELRYEHWTDEAGQARRTPRVFARVLSWIGRPERPPSLSSAAAYADGPPPEAAANEPALPESVSVPF
ncbi:MAG: single-stranded DNA-binding protein [Alphaproteobacteria bacterium]|nr:single-stranded DNA-binding protein [Alphaproteobacteria bacterium]